MARTTRVELIDDIDGSVADTTVGFGLDGSTYEIDLSDVNAQRLRDELGQWVSVARRTGGGKKTSVKPAKNSDTAEIRAWAQDHGYGVADRGRIPAHVIQDYRNSH